jgi:hypothetical protein
VRVGLYATQTGNDRMISTLIYTSKSTFNGSDHEFGSQMDQIQHTATIHNAEVGITGFLMFFENRFVQILEGDFENVTSLYGSIRRDPRHCETRIVWFSEHDERQFDTWSMDCSMSFIKENFADLGVKLKFLSRFITEKPVPHIMLRDLLISVAQEIQKKKEFPRPRLVA